MGNENPTPPPPPSEDVEKLEELTIDHLPERFKFIETDLLRERRKLLMASLIDDEGLFDNRLSGYLDEADRICNLHTDKQGNLLVRAGRDLALALIKRDSAIIATKLSPDKERDLLFDYKDILCDVSDLEITLIQMGGADPQDFRVIDSEIDRLLALVGRRPKS